ncbi:Riboflavin synthase alpha chain [Hyella patelloides LEGE 07179]|uniref:Riboflavin synthase n=1 Tax=Hyella patelloides LEGE 07179 TaxID=945734 RepID=A0A563VLL3_9CYAN|nr:riboflavin synthase [Hyella patelloides]VEP12329.1 Riboflavin synthase alpha chain [Hyella patelloides LEGE 07179]
MFTGLIQELGTINYQTRDSLQILVKNAEKSPILPSLEIGDSVAVDGICLTVETILPQGFIATASPETSQRTTLGQREKSAKYVNLETSLRVGAKIGGHFVTGHVDGIGCLKEALTTQTSWEMSFGAPSGMENQWQQQIAPYLVSKGSIAVNGISLTVAECAFDSSWFKAAVIPHSYEETNLSCLKSGDLVNVESDILGKYVDRLISHRTGHKHQQSDISVSFLAENGYI